MSMISGTQRAAHVRSRVRDFVLYIAIGFAFVGVLILVARSSVSHEAFIKWGVSWVRKFGQWDKWKGCSLTAIKMAGMRSNDDATSTQEPHS
ncbi:MAG: hypothetical protein ACYDC6_15520, partial [Acidobacteriaceae bacterium]